MQVTEAAAEAIQQMREQAGVPGEAGVRVQSTATENGQPALGLAFAEAPDEGDEVTESHGVRVFVEEGLAETLAQATLDATSTDEGTMLVLR